MFRVIVTPPEHDAEKCEAVFGRHHAPLLMPKFREFVFGPWRAVTVLGVTQILAWGALFYPPVLMMPLIAAERGWSLFFAMSGFSLGLLVAGFCAPTVGALIDRHGGHVVMSAGALLGAPDCAAHTGVASGRVSRDLDRSRRRDFGHALRSRLCDARPDFRRRRPPADHRADSRRRLRLDGQLAGDAIFPVMDRLAGRPI